MKALSSSWSKANIKDRSLNLLNENFPALESFTLMTDFKLTLSVCDIHPALERLKLSPWVTFDFEKSAAYLPNIKRLSPQNILDADLFKLGKSFSKLEYLDLKKANVSGAAIVFFACNRSQAIEIRILEFKKEWTQLLPQSLPFVHFIE